MDILSRSSTNFFDIKNKLGDLVVILFLLCLLFIFYRISSLITETFSAMSTILLTMTYGGKGKQLCAVCKKRASASRGFTEEYHLKFRRISRKAFTNVKFLNSFGKDTDVHFKVEYVDGTQCFTIHDCGCLQNIQYKLMSYHPIRLVCQPSSDYRNVFVEGNVEGVLDPSQFKFIEHVQDENPEMRSICSFLDKFLEGQYFQYPVKMHYTKGNIIFGENSHVNAKGSFLLGKETAKSK